MTSDERFHGIVGDIYSARHIRMYAAAGAWIALAGAGTGENDRLAGAAETAAAEPGVGLIELSDRMAETASWASGASAVAMSIAGQLQTAGDASAGATEEALALEERFAEASETPAGPDVGMAAVNASLRQSEERARLVAEAQGVLDRLAASFAQVTGGDAPPAPGGAGGAGGAPSAPGGGALGGGGLAESGGGALMPAANGGLVGAGEYPHGRLLGPEHGDFAGWVRSPSTGFLVDPATGREFDPTAGRWIDPVTGQPFGAVTEYAARLSGLNVGPGAVPTAGGPAVLGPGAGTASLAGLYGGIMPPSIGQAGPAQGQLTRQALRHLGQRANVASRFALHEAAQGGRPFTPPPGAAAHRPGTRPGATGAAPRPAPGAGAPFAAARRDAAARHGLAPPPSGGGRAGRRDRPERERPPVTADDLTEDPSVWTGQRRALRGVLGE